MGESKQQSVDTNVNKSCTRCRQVKAPTEFGEYELHVYDKELKKTQQVMVQHKKCTRCREQQKQYKENNADKHKQYMTICKNKKMQQEVDKETEQVCSRCLKIKPKSDYGVYKTWAFTQDTRPVQEVFLPYKSCKECRDKDKARRRRHTSDDTSSGTSSSYSDQCVYDAGDYEVGFSNM